LLVLVMFVQHFQNIEESHKELFWLFLKCMQIGLCR